MLKNFTPLFTINGTLERKKGKVRSENDVEGGVFIDKLSNFPTT